MTTAIKIKATGYAASELDIQAEDERPGSDRYRLLAQWTGSHVIAFDAEHAELLADIACEWANSIDCDVENGCFANSEHRREQINICRGLWGLASRLRHAAA